MRPSITTAFGIFDMLQQSLRSFIRLNRPKSGRTATICGNKCRCPALPHFISHLRAQRMLMKKGGVMQFPELETAETVSSCLEVQVRESVNIEVNGKAMVCFLTRRTLPLLYVVPISASGTEVTLCQHNFLISQQLFHIIPNIIPYTNACGQFCHPGIYTKPCAQLVGIGTAQ